MPILKSRKDYNFVGKSKRFGSKYLVVNMEGSFAILSPEQHYKLITNNLDDQLYSELESKGVIVTDQNFNEIVENYRRRKNNLFQGTSLHIVVPTLRCNQKCIYCHAASKDINVKGFDMDQETAKKTVDFIFQSPSKAMTIEFQGGEPLVNFPIVKYIVKYAKKINKKHKKDLRFSIVTNLTLMNNKILDYLLKQRVGICTSLDGPKEVHDKNRKYIGGEGSYDDVVKWIKVIKGKENKKEGPRLNALATVTRFSLPYYKEIVDEYQKLGLKKVWFRYLNQLGFAQPAWERISYSAQEFLDFWKKGVDYVHSEKRNMAEMSSGILLKKMLSKDDPNFLDIMSPCGAAIGQMAYMYDGNIYSCDEGRMYGGEFFKLGNVNQDSYTDVLSAPKTCGLIASSVNEEYLCDNCVYQPYCGVCPVWNYVCSANLVPKLATDMRCKILKGQFGHLFKKLIYDKRFRNKLKKVVQTNWIQKEKLDISAI